MNIKDIVGLSFRQLDEKRVRTALTILMVVVGVASIVVLTSQTAGASHSIQSSLNSLGPTSILVIPEGKTLLTSADVANLESLANVSSVTPIVTGSGEMSLDGYNISVTVIGITVSGLDNVLGNSTSIYQGSTYSDGMTPSAVIGHDLAFASSTDTSKQTAYVGDVGSITLQSQGSGSLQSGQSTKTSVPIVGILETHGTSLVPIDSGVIMSLPFAETILHKTSYSEIMVQANSAKNVSALTSLIEVVYGNNARVENIQQLANTFESITNSISLLFLIIGGIALVVAAIGIMNVMLMSVSERIHDIGILKSVGFRSSDVLRIFLLQAIIIGILGGVIGLGSGVATSYVLSFTGGITGSHSQSSTSSVAVSTGSYSHTTVATRSSSGNGRAFSSGSRSELSGASPASSSVSGTGSAFTNIKPVFTPSIIVESLTVAIIISIIAGIYPAWKASKMEPIDALRML